MEETGGILLKPEEVAELTGYTYPAYQLRWLRDNRWAFEVGGDGRPKVLRSYAIRRLGGDPPEAAPEPELQLP